MPKIQNPKMIYMRNFIFGVEDSLVSTVGLLSGITAAGVEKSTILLTGIVLIFVEAFSMAVGSFLSERSTEEYVARHEVTVKYSLIGSVIMFFSYFVSGFIPLSPYVFLQKTQAFWLSIILSLFTLFVLGTSGARMAKINIFWSGLRTLLIGGIAIVVGILVGSWIQL